MTELPGSGGERGRNRTYNLVIKSHLLCQLSYAPDSGIDLRMPALSKTHSRQLFDCSIAWDQRSFASLICRFLGRERSRRDLGDVEQLGRRGGNCRQCIAKHGVAEWARGRDDAGAGGYQLLGALGANPFAFLFAQERQSSTRTATERSLTRTRRIGESAEFRDDIARLIVHVTVA